MRNVLIGATVILLVSVMSAQATCFPKFGTNGPDNLVCDHCGDCKLIGLGGDDTLVGFDGNDVMFPDACEAAGAAGLDPKDCKNGTDIITTGSGQDAIVFNNKGESNEKHMDIITDFDQGNDKIGVAGVFYHAGHLTATWIGTDSFDGLPGEINYRYVYLPTGQIVTIISADLDGDCIPDFQVELIGTIPLTADDFLFNSYPPIS